MTLASVKTGQNSSCQSPTSCENLEVEKGPLWKDWESFFLSRFSQQWTLQSPYFSTQDPLNMILVLASAVPQGHMGTHVEPYTPLILLWALHLCAHQPCSTAWLHMHTWLSTEVPRALFTHSSVSLVPVNVLITFYFSGAGD